MRRTMTVTAAVVLALISAGCGKKDAAVATTTSTTVRPATTSTTLADAHATAETANAEFIAKADAACAADREAKAKITPPRNGDEVIAYLKRALPIEEVAAKALTDLGDPPADADAWNEALDMQKKVLDRVRSLVDDPTYNGDGIMGDTYLKDWQGKADAAFRKFGLKVCGKQQ